MARKHYLVGGAAALAAAAVIAACTPSKDITVQQAVDPLFQSYVSLGNSLTSGWQSDGINDSTQMQAYPVLFAQAANTRFAIPLLNQPGCPPPIDNFQTQSRVGGPLAPPCALRTGSSVTGIINNVAVPGAAAIDPTALSTANSNALTTFILGGQTQVVVASRAAPTFVSMWIGNNDVLGAALSGVLVPVPGVSPGLTDSNTFIARYKADLNGLRANASLKGGALFAVVDVTNVALLFHSNLLFTPYKAEFDFVVGAVTTVDPSCANAIPLIDFQLAAYMHATSQTNVTCKKASVAGPGDLYVLDSAEVPIVQQTVAAYNRYIKAKADSLGWAYVDINPILAALKASGAIPIFPDISSPDTTFGTYVSLDGIHPTLKAHKAIADSMISAVNAKYGTSIPFVP